MFLMLLKKNSVLKKKRYLIKSIIEFDKFNKNDIKSNAKNC